MKYLFIVITILMFSCIVKKDNEKSTITLESIKSRKIKESNVIDFSKLSDSKKFLGKTKEYELFNFFEIILFLEVENLKLKKDILPILRNRNHFRTRLIPQMNINNQKYTDVCKADFTLKISKQKLRNADIEHLKVNIESLIVDTLSNLKFLNKTSLRYKDSSDIESDIIVYNFIQKGTASCFLSYFSNGYIMKVEIDNIKNIKDVGFHNIPSELSNENLFSITTYIGWLQYCIYTWYIFTPDNHLIFMNNNKHYYYDSFDKDDFPLSEHLYPSW